MAASLDISVGFPVFVGDGGERSRCPGGVCLVEEARSPWNKLLLAVFHLAVKRSGADGRPVELRFAGSGGSSVRRCSAPFLVVVEAAVGDDFGRYVCQLREKLGWILSTTCFSGFIPLRGSSSSGVLESLVAIEAPDSLCSGDVVVSGHLIWLVRSSVTKCVDVFDMLLEVPTKTCDPSSRRMSASSSRLDVFLRCVVWLLRPSVTGTTGRTILLGLCCIFYFLQGCPCKIWNVNFMIYL